MKPKEVRRQLVVIRRQLDRMVAGRLHVAFDEEERSRYRQLMDEERHLLADLGPLGTASGCRHPRRFRLFRRRPNRYCRPTL